MNYVQGCILAVPRENRETYRQYSEKMAAIIRGCGALKVVECWGEEVPDGETTSFLKAVKCRDDEVVVFSWSIWKSKEACEAAMHQIHGEAKSHFGDIGKVFDPKRMIFGGFEVLVEV